MLVQKHARLHRPKFNIRNSLQGQFLAVAHIFRFDRSHSLRIRTLVHIFCSWSVLVVWLPTRAILIILWKGPLWRTHLQLRLVHSETHLGVECFCATLGHRLQLAFIERSLHCLRVDIAGPQCLCYLYLYAVILVERIAMWVLILRHAVATEALLRGEEASHASPRRVVILDHIRQHDPTATLIVVVYLLVL